MNRFLAFTSAAGLAGSVALAGCGASADASQMPGGTGPVQTQVEPEATSGSFTVERPERFPVVLSTAYVAAPELTVTGVVGPDVSRQVPVPSTASGRVATIAARLGDTVHKGQLLFTVNSTDVAGTYADYQKAAANERLTRTQLERARVLFEHGVIARSALEVAENAEQNAVVDTATAGERLRILGADPAHPSGVVEVRAPVSGVITDQQVTEGAGVQALSSPSPMTISDMSHLWVLCDVHEDDLARVHVGDHADVELPAYPGRVLRARISNISPTIDPNLRTAKARLEVENPGMLRLGMFVTATFQGGTQERRAAVPAGAILHLHDRQWVYTLAGGGTFRREEVVAGRVLPNGLQEIVSGLPAGVPVVANALALQNTAEQ